MWKQRSKVHWLKEGDKNTAFFHARASAHKEKNTMARLQNDDGVWCSKEMEVAGIAIKYFENLFASSNPLYIPELMKEVFPRIMPEMNEQLKRPFDAEEVRIATFQIFPTKTLGLDGMPPLFFQNF